MLYKVNKPTKATLVSCQLLLVLIESMYKNQQLVSENLNLNLRKH